MTQIVQIFISYMIIILLNSCIDNKTELKESNYLLDTTYTIAQKTIISNYTVSILLLNDYNDSTIICKRWYKEDTLIKEEGKSYIYTPVQSEFVSDGTVFNAKGENTHETFDPLICEVGGHSAWNKYVFEYNNNREPLKVSHYKAWYEDIDEAGNEIINTIPKYFLAEQSEFIYGNQLISQTTKDTSNTIVERIVNKYNNKKQLESTEYLYDQKRYLIFYSYE